MGHTILFSEFQMGHTILFLTKKNSDKNTRGEHLKIKQNIPRLRSEDMGDFNVITKPPLRYPSSRSGIGKRSFSWNFYCNFSWNCMKLSSEFHETLKFRLLIFETQFQLKNSESTSTTPVNSCLSHINFLLKFLKPFHIKPSYYYSKSTTAFRT